MSVTVGMTSSLEKRVADAGGEGGVYIRQRGGVERRRSTACGRAKMELYEAQISGSGHRSFIRRG